MKKVIVLLSIVLLLMTGCSIKKLDDKDFESNMNVLLSEKVSNSNVNFEGYKYYVPEGLKFVNKEEYNAIFKDRFNNKYYLYVDVISYYHKTPIKYKEDKSLYYSKYFDSTKKAGYLEVSEAKDNNKYYVEFVYNYAKMEALVSRDDLVDVITNMAYILRSVSYNDKVLDSLVGENILSYAEETFTLFETEASQSDFIDVVSKYDDGFREAKDQEEIQINDD